LEIMEQEGLMLNVLCFNCGVMFKVEVGTKNPTARCKECQD
jgi:hypothetical protein